MKTWQQARLQPDVLRLYPTFKEWKHYCKNFMASLNEVYILPLRNENVVSQTEFS